MRARLLPLLLLTVLLAGCAVRDDAEDGLTPGPTSGAPTATPPQAAATLQVTSPGANATWHLTFDPASRPSAPAYGNGSYERPDEFTVHDLLVVWAAAHGEAFTLGGLHDEFGYSVESLRGLEAQSNATGGWFWSLQMDGETSLEGMSSAAVADGTAVRWVYTRWDA